MKFEFPFHGSSSSSSSRILSMVVQFFSFYCFVLFHSASASAYKFMEINLVCVAGVLVHAIAYCVGCFMIKYYSSIIINIIFEIHERYTLIRHGRCVDVVYCRYCCFRSCFFFLFLFLAKPIWMDSEYVVRMCTRHMRSADTHARTHICISEMA